MRIIVFLSLVFFQIQLLSAQVTLSKAIDFEAIGRTPSEALAQLSAQTGLDIAYSSNFFKKKELINIQVENSTIEAVIKQILYNQSIEYKLVGERIVFFRVKPKSYTISGFIRDAETGERLISATLYCPQLQKGTTTNEYGFYSLTLPQGDVYLHYSYIGYQTANTHIELRQNLQKNIELSSDVLLTEIIVTPYQADQDSTIQVFEYADQLLPSMLKDSPDLGGENDIVRSASMLAGVQLGADGLGGVHVRGSESSHNLMLIDGVQVYIPYHSLGLFSIYNTEAIRSAKLLKGGFSARYGGATASVFDVRMREGNLQRWSGALKVGPVASSVLIEGPFQKGKGSILLAGRLGYTDLLFNSFLKKTYFENEDTELDTGFYDMNIKVNYAFSEKDNLYLSFYKSGDSFNADNEFENEEFDAEEELEMAWGNTIFALRWNHLFSKKCFANTTLTYSDFGHQFTTLSELEFKNGYGYGYEEPFVDVFFLNNESRNRDLGLKIDIDYLPSPKHQFRFGAGISSRSFTPDITLFNETDIEVDELDSLSIDDLTQFVERDTDKALESFVYAEDAIQLSPNWQLNLGLRLTSFVNVEEDQIYAHAEPRLGLFYAVSPQLKLRAGASKMVQYIHLAASEAQRFPNDIWHPSSEYLQPQVAYQAELGLDWIMNTHWGMTVDAYTKQMVNLYLLPSYGNLNSEINALFPEELLIRGEGRAKGIESTLLFNNSKLSGWLSYTLATSDRVFAAENDGETYSFAYDYRHQAKLYAQYALLPDFDIGFNLQYQSPNPQLTINAVDGSSPSTEVESKNKLRSKSYYRVDINFRYLLKKNRLQHEFKLGVYNINNRKNIAFYRPSIEEDSSSYDPQIVNESLYGLPILPSISYTFRF